MDEEAQRSAWHSSQLARANVLLGLRIRRPDEPGKTPPHKTSVAAVLLWRGGRTGHIMQQRSVLSRRPSCSLHHRRRERVLVDWSSSKRTAARDTWTRRAAVQKLSLSRYVCVRSRASAPSASAAPGTGRGPMHCSTSRTPGLVPPTVRSRVMSVSTPAPTSTPSNDSGGVTSSASSSSESGSACAIRYPSKSDVDRSLMRRRPMTSMW
mmetsp:Transcript_8176/g.24661  ORF Transcript_8176/g.24661 Transcript_8176/m.24661 type:complete len:209 (-) Transcript_8176:1038-1664(-)